MRRLLIISGLLLSIFSCGKDVESQEKAALVAFQDFTMCAGCGGWILKVDDQSLRADLPISFTRPNTAVWLRYERDEKKAGNWINVLSIRERLP
ncbi:hypothetical protein [uncultured Fibrella sp.]|uniref:hypothetical protein n=1 Tax=uncultured Fibrella sp. TaxID=1284596 RepID=UPI0035CB82D5